MIPNSPYDNSRIVAQPISHKPVGVTIFPVRDRYQNPLFDQQKGVGIAGAAINGTPGSSSYVKPGTTLVQPFPIKYVDTFTGTEVDPTRLEPFPSTTPTQKLKKFKPPTHTAAPTQMLMQDYTDGPIALRRPREENKVLLDTTPYIPHTNGELRIEPLYT